MNYATLLQATIERAAAFRLSDYQTYILFTALVWSVGFQTGVRRERNHWLRRMLGREKE